MNPPMISRLEKMKSIGMIIMVISLPFSESVKEISIIFLFIIVLVQLYKKEIKLEMSLVHWGFLFLVVSALISSLLANHPVKSLTGFIDICFFAVPFGVAASLQDQKYIRLILWSFCLSTALAALAGIFHSITIQRPLEIHSLGNQNYTAMYFVISLTSMLSMIIFSRESAGWKILIGVLALITMTATVMTSMRTSFLALFLFLLILVFSNNNRITQVITLSLGGFLIFAALLYEPMRQKMFITTSLFSRIALWQHAWELFKQNFFWGVGLNHYQYTFPVDVLPEAGATYFDAHSLYFQTASQMGLVGLTTIAMIGVGLLHRCLRIDGLNSLQKCLKYAALGGFCVIFIGGVLDTTLHHQQAIPFAFLTGLLFGYSSRNSPQPIPRIAAIKKFVAMECKIHSKQQ